MPNDKKDASEANGKLKSKDYERELARLHLRAAIGVAAIIAASFTRRPAHASV
jgi:hypothetical protein